MNKDLFPHYWICDNCAKERGGEWPDEHVATVAKKMCKYCDGKNQTNDFISPYVDYDWHTVKTKHLRD